MDARKLLEAKSVLDDAERSSSGNYKIADLRKRMESRRKTLDQEIEKVLAETGSKEILSQKLEQTIALMQENLPELKKTLQMFQLASGAKQRDTQSVVEKTVFLANGVEDPKNHEVRIQPSKTSRRKTKQI